MPKILNLVLVFYLCIDIELPFVGLYCCLTCFIYAFDQPTGKLFVQKILGTQSFFFEKKTRGTSYLNCCQYSHFEAEFY